MGILNVNGYYDDFLHMIDKIVEKGFFQREERDRLIIETSPEGLVHKIIQAAGADLP
jgi:predicted Rossmann-fold nucleotide-binding protein